MCGRARRLLEQHVVAREAAPPRAAPPPHLARPALQLALAPAVVAAAEHAHLVALGELQLTCVAVYMDG